MKSIVYFAMIPLFVAGCVTQTETAIPFDLPEGVTYTDSEEAVEFHSFLWGKNDATAVFMIYPHPAGLSRESVDKLATDQHHLSQFESQLKEIDTVKTVRREIVDLDVKTFVGKEIVFTLGTSDGKTFYQCMYALWDGNRLWQGQLTGFKKEDMAMVRTILKSRKESL